LKKAAKIRIFNKSFVTNLTSTAIFGSSFLSSEFSQVLHNIGLFSLSGAITNWLAVHMLFEKVPGLYGSGIIPNRFEEFKSGIQSLIMEQFFNKENINKFFQESGVGGSNQIDLSPLLEEVDYDAIFEKLITAINESQLAPMLQMLGGEKALEPIKPKIIEKIKEALIELSGDPKISSAVQEKIASTMETLNISGQVEAIVTSRLNELTPNMVKEIIQEMIRQHLGWLVVWGGIFGGLIGAISYFMSAA